MDTTNTSLAVGQTQIGIPEGAVYAVFDTETTGLFQFKDKVTGIPIPADADGQPRLASIAIILADAQGNPLARVKRYIAPNGWSIDGTVAADVNGLSDAFLRDEGVPVVEVLDFWNGLVDAGMIFAAFNAQFDCKMMRAELRRAGLPDRFEDTRNVCVMKALDPYGAEGLPIMRGFIKLAAACEYFGIVNAAAHDAMADAEAALAILRILLRDGRLPEAKVHLAKVAAA